MSETSLRGDADGEVSCEDCDDAGFDDLRSPHDHIHEVDALPPARQAEDHLILRGYAVGVRGPHLRDCWFFFEHLEPALVFGRAGRMSTTISGYTVVEASREIRYDRELHDDVTTLHLPRAGKELDRQPGEKAAFQRWLEACDSSSSQFVAPA